MPSPHRPHERKVRRRTWALGVLVLLAVLRFGPVSFSTAMFTSGSQNTASVSSANDWTNPMVDVVDPGAAIRGTVTLSATATDERSGIKDVAIAWAPTGTIDFTTLCTDTSAPYQCPFSTTTSPDQEIDIRAIATDNSGFTMTDVLEGVYVDNTLPTGSLNAIASPLSGVVTIGATAADAASGVDNVVIQRAFSLTPTTWVTICTDVSTPYSCQFDTTTVSDGSYNFRAIVTDVAGNQRTTATVSNRVVSNIANSVSVNDPGPYLRGAVTITANANATAGITSVAIERAPVGTTTWTALCADTTAPYSCPFVTTGVADGQYIFRAILTPTVGATTTSATVGPSQVDNSPVRGHDVQATNAASVGRLAPGDALAVTYTRSMKLTSIMAGWNGASTNVVVRVRDGALVGLTSTQDTLDVFTTSSLSTPVNLGSVNLQGHFVRANRTVTVNATMAASIATVNGQSATQITLTLGTVLTGSSSLRTASSTPAAMLWTPSAMAQDTTNVACSTAVVTELGTNDRDF